MKVAKNGTIWSFSLLTVYDIIYLQLMITDRKQEESMLKIYTVQEVCEYLQVSRNTVYELINQGKLKCKKVGRAYKITENALDDFVNSLGN